jgi:hypothetical protein
VSHRSIHFACQASNDHNAESAGVDGLFHADSPDFYPINCLSPPLVTIFVIHGNVGKPDFHENHAVGIVFIACSGSATCFVLAGGLIVDGFAVRIFRITSRYFLLFLLFLVPDIILPVADLDNLLQVGGKTLFQLKVDFG